MEERDVRVLICATGEIICREADLNHRKTLPYFSLVIPTEGSYRVSLDGRALPEIAAGESFLVPAGVYQDITHVLAASGVMRAKWLFWDVEFAGGLRLGDRYVFPGKLSREQTRPFFLAIDRIAQLQGEGESTTLLRTSEALRFTAELVRLAHRRSGAENPVAPAVAMIREKYMRVLTAGELADCCGMSQTTFRLKFRQAEECTPSEYLERYRLSVASALLEGSALSVREIAERTGFSDQFYFCKRFRARYGLTPTEARRRAAGRYEDGVRTEEFGGQGTGGTTEK